MQTIDCPQKDGVCVVPDPAVVAINGELSLMRHSALIRLFPEASSQPLEWHVLEDRISYVDLLDGVTESLRWQGLAELDDAGIYIGYGRSLQDAPRERIDPVRRLESSLAHDGVIVTCSCGHSWTV